MSSQLRIDADEGSELREAREDVVEGGGVVTGGALDGVEVEARLHDHLDQRRRDRGDQTHGAHRLRIGPRSQDPDHAAQQVHPEQDRVAAEDHGLRATHEIPALAQDRADVELELARHGRFERTGPAFARSRECARRSTVDGVVGGHRALLPLRPDPGWPFVDRPAPPGVAPRRGPRGYRASLHDPTHRTGTTPTPRPRTPIDVE